VLAEEMIQRALELDSGANSISAFAAVTKHVDRRSMGHEKDLPALFTRSPTPVGLLQEEEIFLGQGPDLLDQFAANEEHRPTDRID